VTAFQDSCIDTSLHIGDSSHNGASSRMLDALTHSKISNLDLSFGIEQYILRFDITMDGMACIMDIVKSIQNLRYAMMTLNIMVASSS
jgi:hypothetical protein